MPVDNSNSFSVKDVLALLEKEYTERSTAKDLSTFKTEIDGREQYVVASAARVSEIYKKYYEQMASDSLKAAEANVQRLKELEKVGVPLDDSQVNRIKKYEKDLADFKEECSKKAVKAAHAYQENLYKQSSYSAKRRMAEESKHAIEVKKKELDAVGKFSEEEAKAYNDAIANINKRLKTLDKAKSKPLVSGKGGFSFLDTRSFSERAKDATERASILKERAEESRLNYMAEEDPIKKAELREQYRADSKAAAKAANQASLLGTIAGAVDAINKKMGASVDRAMENLAQYMPKIDSRLQGSGKDYKSISDLIKKNLSVSPFVKQQDMLEQVVKLANAGIAYNIEQRAFLNTISDKIAETFDALDKNLTRLIRLQQADLTAARLGLEASLQTTLNSMFKDTSYLSDVYDTVSGAIVDASAQLNYENSISFEYTVQKWLGALYSLGMSDSFISKVAEGINYLGTGNVQALASNESLQTLMALSASKAGLPYGELFTSKTLTADTTNKLLQGMIEYLRDIAENTDNRVVRSAYGDIFGLTLSDLKAAANLSLADITSISRSTMDFSSAMGELSDQLDQVSSRTSTSVKIDNIFSNFLYTTGSNIAEHAASYVLWKVASMIQEVSPTGGIHIPAVSVLGNMVDLSSFTVEGMLKAGLVGISSLGMIGQIISTIGTKGRLDLSAWGGTSTLQRGSIGGLTTGGRGISGSAYVGSSSSEDVYSSSLTGATEESEKTSKITNKNVKTKHTTDDIYDALFTEGSQIPMKVHVVNTDIGVKLYDIDGKESDTIRDYIDKKVESVVDAVLSSGSPFSLGGEPLAVTISNEDPVPVSIQNTEILDYYTDQNLKVPLTEM